ncbi:EAL domain-containing protein [Candidatus Pantoea formicae]|uniref:EAL domain-containing protein n=1 Tax=Candidatus Pantoea formicae TaxID=2608355 RepID=UPI003EDA77C1
MIVINQKLILTYEYEPIVNFRQDVIAYELITRPLMSPDYEDFIPAKLFSGMDPEKKIEIFNNQMLEINKYSGVFTRENIKVSINIDDDHLMYFKENENILRDISESDFIELDFHEINWNTKRDAHADFKMFHSYGIGVWLDNFDVYKLSTSESDLAYFKGVKFDKHFYRYILKKHNKESYFVQIIQRLKKLGKKVIVEGVENSEHFNFLLNKNIDGMQGKVWSPKKSVT